MDSTEVITALSALAQPTRLAIFRLLVVCGPTGMVAGQMAEKLQVSAANMSFHFKTLSHAGLIASRQEGRFVYYVADFTTMNEMLTYLTDNCCADSRSGCDLPVSLCQHKEI